MPFNGSGVFTRIYSWQADKAAGIDITASRMDTDTNDITANGLSVCLTRDGQGQPTSNLPMNGFRHTGASNAVGSGDYVTLGQVQSSLTTASLTVTGTTLLENFTTVRVGSTAQFGLYNSDGSQPYLICDNTGHITTAHGNTNPIGSNTNGWVWDQNGNASAFATTGSNINFGIPGNGTFIGFFNGTSTVVGSIQVSGGVTAYNTTSDETLKDFVAPLTDSGSIIDRLQALWYRWKDRPVSTPEPGFFAQAVHRIFPWAVTPGDGKRPWQMDASRLMPVVIAELQALRKRVAELEGR